MNNLNLKRMEAIKDDTTYHSMPQQATAYGRPGKTGYISSIRTNTPARMLIVDSVEM